MSYFKNSGVLVQEYEYDYSVDGGATGDIVLSTKANKDPLPTGGVIVRVVTMGQTSLAGASASASIGHLGSKALYKANAAATALAGSAVFDYNTPIKVDSTNEQTVLLRVTGAALTAGKLKVLVEYIFPNS